VRVGLEGDAQLAELRAAFPECAEAAQRFHIEAARIADALHDAATRMPALATASKLQRMRLAAREPRLARRVFATLNETAAQRLGGTSARFRRFIDAQLQIFAQTSSAHCAYLYSAIALSQPLRGMYAICGGAGALVAALVASIKQSGGAVRLNAHALRLACDAQGRAVGVELLSGETVAASRAVVSNLTVWDTYGKLIGLSRTPHELRARLKSLRGWGAYQIFASMDEAAAARLPSGHILALTDWQSEGAFEPESALFMFSAAPDGDARAPAGKRAVTISTFTEAEPWFSFHEDETELEAQDQTALERWWARVHASLPELGDGIEVIETATPRSYYEVTRRKFGMVGGVGQSLDTFGASSPTHHTTIPNLYMVGDTVFPGNGVAAVTHSALVVANEIAPSR
jgi:phytoene dehydrogenase-like protein